MRGAGEARIAAILRIERARLIARLARVLRGDLALAEDLAQDALVAALQVWLRQGMPDSPGAWLAAVARRKSIDLSHHRRMRMGKHALIAAGLSESHEADGCDHADPDDPHDLQALIFATCHPALDARSAAALALRLLAGLTVPEIARLSTSMNIPRIAIIWPSAADTGTPPPASPRTPPVPDPENDWPPIPAVESPAIDHPRTACAFTVRTCPDAGA